MFCFRNSEKQVDSFNFKVDDNLALISDIFNFVVDSLYRMHVLRDESLKFFL